MTNSEMILDADLRLAGIAQQPVRLGVAAVVVGITEIVVVEDIEHVHRHAQGSPRNVGEVLPQPEIHLAIGPTAGEDERVLRWSETAGRVACEREDAPHVVTWTSAERDEAAELHARRVGHVHRPVRDEPALLVTRGVLRVRGGPGERGKHIPDCVTPLERAGSARVGHSSSPAPTASSLVWPVHFYLQRVIPRLGAVGAVDDVAEPVSVSPTQTARAVGLERKVAPIEDEPIPASDAHVCQGDRYVSEQTTNAEVELARLRHLDTVRDQPDFAARGFVAADERLEHRSRAS